MGTRAKLYSDHCVLPCNLYVDLLALINTLLAPGLSPITVPLAISLWMCQSVGARFTALSPGVPPFPGMPAQEFVQLI